MNTTKAAGDAGSPVRTVSGMLQRAVSVGQQIEGVLGDVGLQRLSKAAWLNMAAELAAGADLDELQAKIEGLPYLANLVERTARRWVQDLQDRPCPDGIFSNGHSELAAYAERLAAGLSVEQASACLAVRVAEIHVPEYWGRLTSFAEVPAQLDPLQAELAELDRQLHVDLRVRDVTWVDGRGTLCSGSVTVTLDAGSVAQPATTIAQASRHALRTELQQAA